ncbi:hypothetical protein [Streptomyces sp. AS02]|uniref:hypothetical protein n=1 Tax=Streptomyces sp. AS02 TaxID=2938946 RepID=UPI002021D0F2|nr:hypothetical protein [Streptomyces sp. AS02]MCL8011771.1 hypothetical protein [Streptomyces sp. AS02]
MRRLLTVGLAPCGLFVTSLWSLLRAGSFTGRSDWGRVVPVTPGATAGNLLLLIACASVLALLLQPFQVRAVRVLEGYWDRWPVTARLAGALMELQRRRRQALRGRAEGRAGADADARRVAADAFRRMAAAAPEDVLLPTALGNALRAGELSAGERYGLETLSSWPRIHLQVSDRLAQVLHSARTALDTSANLCWSFLACAVLTSTALYDEPGVRWLPVAAVLLAAVAYKGAVTAAQAYSGLMHVVYDLHRFDLLEALHHPLPDRRGEVETFWRVSESFAGRDENGLPYEHSRGPLMSRRGGSGPGDADAAAET